MVRVIAWPPVGLTAWELTKHHSVSRSEDMFGRPTRTSSAGRPRYLASATVSGIGTDSNGSGYVEMLKDQMRGGANLVRVPSMAPVWYLPAKSRLGMVADRIEWTAGGADLYWTAGGENLVWLEDSGINGTLAADAGWGALSVTGMPPNTTVRPSEFIEVFDGYTNETRRVLKPATSDAEGNALIRVDEPFTIQGVVSIGVMKNLVFQAQDMPRAVQPASGDWTFEWAFRQVHEDEAQGGFEDVDPWR